MVELDSLLNGHFVLSDTAFTFAKVLVDSLNLVQVLLQDCIYFETVQLSSLFAETSPVTLAFLIEV
jgi:hypothetical protein